MFFRNFVQIRILPSRDKGHTIKPAFDLVINCFGEPANANNEDCLQLFFIRCLVLIKQLFDKFIPYAVNANKLHHIFIHGNHARVNGSHTAGSRHAKRVFEKGLKAFLKRRKIKRRHLGTCPWAVDEASFSPGMPFLTYQSPEEHEDEPTSSQSEAQVRRPRKDI